MNQCGCSKRYKQAREFHISQIPLLYLLLLFVLLQLFFICVFYFSYRTIPLLDQHNHEIEGSNLLVRIVKTSQGTYYPFVRRQFFRLGVEGVLPRRSSSSHLPRMQPLLLVATIKSNVIGIVPISIGYASRQPSAAMSCLNLVTPRKRLTLSFGLGVERVSLLGAR